jgi:hypothetical protein
VAVPRAFFTRSRVAVGTGVTVLLVGASAIGIALVRSGEPSAQHTLDRPRPAVTTTADGPRHTLAPTTVPLSTPAEPAATTAPTRGTVPRPGPTSGRTAAPVRVPPPPTPPKPTASSAAEGEALAPGATVHDASASGGAFARATSVEGPLHVPAGTYLVRARVRSHSPVRADLGVAGELVGSWTLSADWQDVAGVAFVGAGEAVGVRAVSPIDVDRISLEPADPVITVRGTRLVAPDGHTFKPRGVNFPGYNAPRTEGGRLQLPLAPVDHFHRWGITLVRLALNQEHWLANCPSVMGDERMGYRDAIARTVDELQARGVAAMLTLTVTERGRATGCAPASDPLLKEMADGRSPGFWVSVGQTFRGRPLVMFDLFNEPNNISEDVWRNGGRVEPNRGNAYQASGMQTLYESVRSTGAWSAVTVSGTWWAGKPSLLLSKALDGAGIAAALHVYCHDCRSPRLPDGLDGNVAGVRARHPLVLTEGGWDNSDDGRYNRLLIDWSEANAAGWAIYAFFMPEQPFSVVREWKQASHSIGGGEYTLAPSRRGAPVWNSLAAERTGRGYSAALVAE